MAGAVSTVLFNARFAHSSASTSRAESAVEQLYASLTEKQKKAICLPFDHKNRRRINANWHVTDTTIGDDLFTKQQKAIIEQIVRNITSEDGYQRIIRQMEDDDGGMDNYSIAIFGDPGANKFQWEMTGRHLTMRADGNQCRQSRVRRADRLWPR